MRLEFLRRSNHVGVRFFFSLYEWNNQRIHQDIWFSSPPCICNKQRKNESENATIFIEYLLIVDRRR
jgi:hypothetical protein